MERVCAEFGVALYNLLSAVFSQEVKVAAVAECCEAVKEQAEEEPAPAPAPKVRKPRFPKTFAAWVADKGTEWGKVICTKWTTEEITFLVPADVKDHIDDTIGEVTDELRTITGNKMVKIDCVDQPAPKAAPIPPPVAVPVPPKVNAEVVSADAVKAACVAVALKLKSKAKVLEILKQFGAEKVDQIDPSHYPAIKAALKAAMETSPQMSVSDADGY